VDGWRLAYNVRKATCGTVCRECDGTVDSLIFLSPFAVAVGGTAKETFYLTYNTGGQYDYSGSATARSSEARPCRFSQPISRTAST